jgi:serine protein kinase
MSDRIDISDFVSSRQKLQHFEELHWTGAFQEYLDVVVANPRVTRTAFERLYDMILSYGTDKYVEFKKEITTYHCFSDPEFARRDAIFGLEVPLMKLVNIFKAAAQRYGPERRVLLLHGPVGSAKSTIVRLLKKGLEQYSRTPEGMLFTFGWCMDLEHEPRRFLDCPMHEEPLHLVPAAMRPELIAAINSRAATDYLVYVEGSLCPFCRRNYEELQHRHNGDWTKIMEHVCVRRLILSEQDRVGIGTFQPKDEKNQDSTELTGDINYRKIAEYGSDSDPRAFNFDGEFNVANRGLIEFIEILKLDVAFLYDLLGATQEHKIKPKKFAQTDIDEVIIGHTNEPEYRKLQKNEFMEALRDRTVKVDIPYVTKLSEELKIYEKDFGTDKIRGKHIAPHSLEIAAMWAVLTRLEESKDPHLTPLMKMRLYDGKKVEDYTSDKVRELRKETEREGMEGISPRYVQDKISNALVSDRAGSCVNPFMVMSELDSGLRHHSLITNEEQRKRFAELLQSVKEEYEKLAKNDVMRAVASDEEAITRLCAKYIDNIKAYTRKEKVRNPYTQQDEEPDERLMRSIEEKINIDDSRKEVFRQQVMNYIATLAIEGKPFKYKDDAQLHRALEMKLFDDRKDSIRLTNLVEHVVDKDAQEKIDVVKNHLIKHHGYCEVCAGDVLTYVAGILAREEPES